jgi:GNAT superfamily N-acetyltransferase
MEMRPELRAATFADQPALERLIEASVRELSASHYSPAQIEASLTTAFSIDTQLIADGTYYVATIAGELAACGGWSWRKTLCGGSHHVHRDPSPLNPATDAAKIRAIFVAPRYARRGLGTLLLRRAEEAATAAGFSRMEMGATLVGVPLYEREGYVEVERMNIPLRDGITLPVVRMVKVILA